MTEGWFHLRVVRAAALARGEITSLQTVSIPTVNSARPEAFARAQVATSEGKKLHRRPFYWRAIGERDADGTYLPGPCVQWRPERTRGERRLIKRERERETRRVNRATRCQRMDLICHLHVEAGSVKKPTKRYLHSVYSHLRRAIQERQECVPRRKLSK